MVGKADSGIGGGTEPRLNNNSKESTVLLPYQEGREGWAKADRSHRAAMAIEGDAAICPRLPNELRDKKNQHISRQFQGGEDYCTTREESMLW